MKRLFAFCLTLALCLALAGCRSSGTLLPSEAGAGQTTGTNETTNGVFLPTEGAEIVGEDLNFANVETRRIGYSGLKSSVIYVTSPAQLPQNDAFAKYDEAFFREHALVLVTDTVGSGSIRVGVERITVSGDTAYVFVSRELPGDMGTCDMATWYVWAEVETGLTLQWKVANPVYAQTNDDKVSK